MGEGLPQAGASSTSPDNPIGDEEGGVAIAASLEKRALPKLERLHLNESEIGDEGLKALMAASCRWRAREAEFLNVRDNQLSEEAIEALAEAIENGTLPSRTGDGAHGADLVTMSRSGI